MRSFDVLIVGGGPAGSSCAWGLRQKIAQRAAKGETPYAIAKALRIDRHTVAKYAG